MCRCYMSNILLHLLIIDQFYGAFDPKYTNCKWLVHRDKR